MADTTGQADLRAANVERMVKGFALTNYRMKELVAVNSSNSWKESYYQETAADLTGGLGSAVKGVPRLANFPYLEPSWTLKNAWLVKHGGEGVVSYEDEKTNNVDVIARTLLRVASAVVKSVDAEIYNGLSENDTPSAINTLALTAGYEWDSATIANRDPIQDLLNARALIDNDDYDIDVDGFLAINPTDFANIMGNANVRNAGQFWTSDVTKNGKVGRMCVLTVKVSNSVTADEAMVMVPKIAGTWKQVSALTVKSIEDPGIKWTIRAWELGVTQVTNPNACCKITNTAA